MDIDDDDEWIPCDGDVPNGQSQLEMMTMMLDIEDVLFMELEPNHRSHRMHIETVDEVATCPTCCSSADPMGRPVRDLVAPERFFGKVVICVGQARRWRCPNPECATTTFEDEPPPLVLPGMCSVGSSDLNRTG